MEIYVAEELKKICASLKKHGVKFMIVGGIAVNLYGVPRYTEDIDLLVDTSIQDIMGHAHLTTTTVYLRISGQEARGILK